jgi:hypothetical protein
MSENLPAPSVIGGAIMPAQAVRAQAAAFKEYLEAVREFVRDVLSEGIEADYGKIPGTKRLTLLQPGADKLCGLFSFVPKFILEDRTEDKDTGRYDVRYRCELYRGEVKVGEAVAFASSFESKWRYRFGSRKCPSCGGDTIRRSKFAPRGGGEPGWYCSDKGCGGQFAVNDPAVTDQQEVGKITNVDIVDVFNTVEQVCQKRAKVAAVRNATRLTDMFTQDVGDPENQKGEDAADSHAQQRNDDPPYAPEDTHTTDRKPAAPVMLDKTTRELFAAQVGKLTPDAKDVDRAKLIAKVGKATIAGYTDWRYLAEAQLDPLLTAIKTETEKG